MPPSWPIMTYSFTLMDSSMANFNNKLRLGQTPCPALCPPVGLSSQRFFLGLVPSLRWHTLSPKSFDSLHFRSCPRLLALWQMVLPTVANQQYKYLKAQAYVAILVYWFLFKILHFLLKFYQSIYSWLPKIVSTLKNSPWKSFIHAQDPLVIPGVVQQRDFRDYVSHALRDLRDDGLPFRTCPRLPALWQIVFSNSCQPTAQICQGRKLFAPIQWQLFIHSLVSFLTVGKQ